jgi:hypothetical protein
MRMFRLLSALFLSVCALPLLAQNQDWATPAEKSDYRTTPNYEETMAYIRRVAAAAPKQVKLISFGKTGEGRDLWAAIVSKDGVFDPAKIHAANRPIVYVQNSIHAGEMDGKDSCLALMRDMLITKSQAKLLDRAVVMIIPMYNADGHERRSPYNRINQNGPAEMGFRTQSNNLNLNRDYLKADAVETRAFLRFFNEWLPDFFIDDHVTDGADFQYDTTYTIDVGPDVDPALAAWQRDQLKPYIEKSVTDAGHVIGQYVGVGEADPVKGLSVQQDIPRFSTGYMIEQNRPGLLVEIHMLKDYKTRVTGNYEILRAILEVVNRDADKLTKMNRDADAATIAGGKANDPQKQFPLRLKTTAASTPFHFLGYKRIRALSEVSGTIWNQYVHEKEEIDLPLHDQIAPSYTVTVPRAYIVPAQWTNVIDVLNAHGVQMLRTSEAWSGDVDTYRCAAKWSDKPFESHITLAGNSDLGTQTGSGLSCEKTREKLSFPKGSAVVPMDQRAAKVAMHWLEPMGPDSAVNWGLFNAIFEVKEYGEPYVLEKLAREMMAKDPKLKQEFESKIASDPEFAGDSDARLWFFFRRSPYWDQHVGLYPVGRLNSLDGVPVGK